MHEKAGKELFKDYISCVPIHLNMFYTAISCLPLCLYDVHINICYEQEVSATVMNQPLRPWRIASVHKAAPHTYKQHMVDDDGRQ